MNIDWLSCRCAPGYLCPLCMVMAALGIAVICAISGYAIAKRRKR